MSSNNVMYIAYTAYTTPYVRFAVD